MCVGVHVAVIMFATGYLLCSLLYVLLDLRRVSLLSLPPVSWFGYSMTLGYAMILGYAMVTDTCATVSGFYAGPRDSNSGHQVLYSNSDPSSNLPSWKPASSDLGQWPANT